MKITFWRLVCVVFILALVIKIGDGLGMQINDTLRNFTPSTWNMIIFIVGAVIAFIGLMYLWGLWQQRQLIESEIDLNKADAEAKRGKADKERSGADKNRAEADNSRVKTKAEVEVIEVEADIKRQEVVGKQIENAKAAVDVELSKALLIRADELIDKAINSDVPYALNAPGSFTLTAKVPRSITNNAAGEIGPSENIRQVVFLDKIRESLQGDGNRYALVGGMGYGKTTALKYIAREFVLKYGADGCTLVVLDPHSPPRTWPSSAMVFGAGKNYFEIGRGMEWVFDVMDKRYNNVGAKYKPMMLINDEWGNIVQHLKGTRVWTEQRIYEFFTGPRKANIGYALALHDTTNGSFGIKTGAGLKAAIRLTFSFNQDPVTNDYEAYLIHKADKGKGKTAEYIPCEMPGPFHDPVDDYTDEQKAQWQKDFIPKIAPASGDLMDLSELMEKPNTGHGQVSLNDEFVLNIMAGLITQFGDTSATEVMEVCKINKTDGRFRKRVNSLAEANNIPLGRAKKR